MNGLVILESKRKAMNLEHELRNNLPTTDKWSCIYTGGQLIDIEPRSVSKTGPTITVQVDYTVRFNQFAKTIKEAIDRSDIIVIATDPDREGERIAMDITRYFSNSLKNKEIKRIDLYQMTAKGFSEALERSRPIDLSLAHAAKIRAVIDKYIGYSLSSLAGVALGRVQTPVLSAIDKGQKNTKIVFVPSKNGSIQAEVVGLEQISALQQKRPASTWDVLKKASNMGVSPMNTMKAMQGLYADGLLSYPRTDSIRLSEKSLKDYIRLMNLSISESNIKSLATELANADLTRGSELASRIDDKSAHEALHILGDISDNRSEDELMVTKIINDSLNATLSTLEVPTLAQTTFKVETTENAYITTMFTPLSHWAIGEAVPGDAQIIPGMSMEDAIMFMEDNCLGRPSTAADITTSLVEKQYVTKESNGRIKVSPQGQIALDATSRLAPILLSPAFTAQMEKDLKRLATTNAAYTTDRYDIEQSILRAAFGLVQTAEQKAKENLQFAPHIYVGPRKEFSPEIQPKTFKGRPVLDDICSDVTVTLAS